MINIYIIRNKLFLKMLYSPIPAELAASFIRLGVAVMPLEELQTKLAQDFSDKKLGAEKPLNFGKLERM